MLIEEAAYASRLRMIAPEAKALFAVTGMLAALLASNPMAALGIFALLMLATLTVAGTPGRLYLQVIAPPLGFLALSSLSLLFSLSSDAGGNLAWQLAPDAAPRIAGLSSRSLAALGAMLFLVLSTPLPELIALLRRLRMPEVLLDLMVLCYRMIFVISEALGNTLTAQQARLGHASARHSLRSLGLLMASLAMQIWLRASHLHQAAMARNGDGPLRFLAREYPSRRRDLGLALLGSTLLIAISKPW